MELATTVVLAVLRGPVPLAKTLAALDVLSGRPADRHPRARVVPARLRGARHPVRRALEAVRRGRLHACGRCSRDARPTSTYAPGPAAASRCGSPAGARPPACAGSRGLADGWLASAYNTTPDRFAAARTELAAELTRRGRGADGFPNALATMWTWVTDDRADRRPRRSTLSSRPLLQARPGRPPRPGSASSRPSSAPRSCRVFARRQLRPRVPLAARRRAAARSSGWRARSPRTSQAPDRNPFHRTKEYGPSTIQRLLGGSAMRFGRGLFVVAVAMAMFTFASGAHWHTGGGGATSVSVAAAVVASPDDAFSNFTLMAASPLPTTTSSDIAFWNVNGRTSATTGGFRIFDITGDAPVLLDDVALQRRAGRPVGMGPDEDGAADMLILSVDRTMAGPECGAGRGGARLARTAGRACGSSTSPTRRTSRRSRPSTRTAARTRTRSYPRPDEDRCSSSTPRIRCAPARRAARARARGRARPAPRRGPGRRGPARRPDSSPRRSQSSRSRIPVTSDNNYLPISRALPERRRRLHQARRRHACLPRHRRVHRGRSRSRGMREQAQVWRLDKETGLPDTENPHVGLRPGQRRLLALRDVLVGRRIVNFIDESFGDRCPTTTFKQRARSATAL